MTITENIKHAFGTFLSSKLRTILAMLGILVGTASVVALVTAGNLATQQALAQVKNIGTDLLSVSIYNSNQQSTTGPTEKLSIPMAQGIAKISPGINIVAPYITVFQATSYLGNKINSTTIGATQALQDVIKIKLQQGRFISFLDQYEYYCVIGNRIYNELIAINPTGVLGTQIVIGPLTFTIIGIAEHWPQNNFFDQDINNSIIVPIQTAAFMSQYATINDVIILLHPNADIDAVENAINDYVSKNLPSFKTFQRSAKQLIQGIKNQREILTLLLGLIGSISLLVGGIGIMNIMLVSVVERRQEIGIRRALGARKRDIQAMFLIEGTILSLVGGILGVFTGIGAAFIIAEYANWQFHLLIIPPIIGFTVSVLIGIFFGFYPAHKASQLDPIETLRGE